MFFLKHFENTPVVKASKQRVRMTPIERHASLVSQQPIFVKEISMRLKISFVFNEIIQDATVLVLFGWIDSCCELLNLLWFQQEEIGDTVSTKDFH